MNRCGTVFAVLATAVVAGCKSAPAPTGAFDPLAASYVLKNGRNTIEGQALLRSASGYVRTCRNEGVALYAVTAYSQEVVTLASGNTSGGFARAPLFSVLFDSSPLATYSRQSACDDAGRFRFDGVADGQYYLVANIGWMVKSARFGGAVMKSIEVSGGSTRSVELEWMLPY